MKPKQAAKHTPGPWMFQMRRGSLGTRGHVAVLGPDFGSGHADIVRTMGTSEKEESNARLIAAAPDGLALAKIVADMKHLSGENRRNQEIVAYELAKHIIAKAEGK